VNETYFHRDGFRIFATQKEFFFDSRKNRETLKVIDDRLNRTTFIDTNCDKKVDQIIQNRKTSYMRGDVGTDPLFKKADEVFQRLRDSMSVDDKKRKWKKFKATNIGGINGIGNF